MKAIISWFGLLLVGCASATTSSRQTFVVRGESHRVTLQAPTKWRVIIEPWPSPRRIAFSLHEIAAPSLDIRLDPAKSVDHQGQQAIHRAILNGFRDTFDSPAAQIVAVVPLHGENISVMFYTGVGKHQYAAVIPLGRETVSFWLGDAHGEDIRPYQKDFIRLLESAKFE